MLTYKGAEFYKELEATWFELANAVKALTDSEQQHSFNNNPTNNLDDNFNKA